MPKRKKGKTMQINIIPEHTCEVCGRHLCRHCQECGTPSTDHATTCSRYVHTKTVYDNESENTFRLTMRDGKLLTLQTLAHDFPIAWESITPNDDPWEWWEFWQNRIHRGFFDPNVN